MRDGKGIADPNDGGNKHDEAGKSGFGVVLDGISTQIARQTRNMWRKG